MLWEQQIPAKHVIPHPKDRSGTGVIYASALASGAKHLAAGYSYKKASNDAIAVQIKPESMLGHSWKTSYNAVFRPQNVPACETVMATTLGGTHRNAFAHAVGSELPCSIAAIAPSGCLDAKKLCAEHDGLREAMEKNPDLDDAQRRSH